MGNTDRIIRVIAAVFFSVLYFTETVTGTLGLVLVVFGAIFLGNLLYYFLPFLNACRHE